MFSELDNPKRAGPLNMGPLSRPPASVPRRIGEAERLLAARAGRERFMRLFERSSVPMLMIDNHRSYVEANTPARLAFRQNLEGGRRSEWVRSAAAPRSPPPAPRHRRVDPAHERTVAVRIPPAPAAISRQDGGAVLKKGASDVSVGRLSD
jgi:hypothetical protein